jgi:hypothetical protein
MVRNAKVWLATLSTVIALATGMFTLRDQIFPREAGNAAAASLPVYQQQVGRVCDQVNHNDSRQVAEARKTRKRVYGAKTTITQRNALLDGVKDTIARSGQTLAAFAALDTPRPLTAAQRNTEAAWNRNLDRLRDYARRLDGAGSTRSGLVAAVAHLSKLRPAISRDGVKLRSGLDRLGAANCDLRPPPVIPALTLPALPAQGQGTDRPTSDVSTPTSEAAPSESPSVDAGSPAPEASAPSPDASPPTGSGGSPGAGGGG